MADTHETIADIIAEKRRRADEIERDCAEKMKRGEMTSDQYARELVANIRREADRLEAAHRRELSKNASKNGADFGQLGDCAKLREALSKLCAYSAVVLNAGMFNRVHLEALLNMATAALAAPPRNCDVGTAEEQAKRLNEWCNGRHCINCRYKGGLLDECKLKWAQMPYTEGDGR